MDGREGRNDERVEFAGRTIVSQRWHLAVISRCVYQTAYRPFGKDLTSLQRESWGFLSSSYSGILEWNSESDVRCQEFDNEISTGIRGVAKPISYGYSLSEDHPLVDGAWGDLVISNCQQKKSALRSFVDCCENETVGFNLHLTQRGVFRSKKFR